MGIFKRAKGRDGAVQAASDMVSRARQAGAPTGARAAQATTTETDFNPIAGVSIELYAEISKGLAAYDYDISKGPEVAAAKGVAAGDWGEAMEGWNGRIKANRAVAQRFNALYTGRT